MRTKRLLGAAAVTALTVAGPLASGIAAAEDPVGVGTGSVSSTLLGVELGAGGSVLSVRVVGDDGRSTIDPAQGTTEASSVLSPLTVKSTLLGIDVAAPTIETRSTGEEDGENQQASLPANPAATGSLGAVLSSIVDAAGARSSLETTLSDLGVAGGLVGLPSAAVTFGTGATSSVADGTRALDIPSMTVLDLGALLDGLGLSLADLPLDTIYGLLGSLGVTIPQVGGVSDVQALVTDLNAVIDAVQGQTGAITDELCATVDGILGDTTGGLPDLGALPDVGEVIGGLPGTGGLLSAAALPANFSCENLTGTVEDLLDTIQADLAGLLAALLATLDGTALLSVENVKAGLVATATDSIDTTVAQVTASIGSVKVGSLAVPGVSGLDLTDGLAALSAAADTVSDTVGSVLAVIDTDLSELVDVEVLKITETVGEEGGYTNALAALTALEITIDPTGLLDGLLGAAALDTSATVGSIISTLGGTVPVLAPAMTALEGVLGNVDALAAPSTVTVGSLSSSAAFTPAALPGGPGSVPTGTPGGELPRTGGDAALPAAIAVLMAGAALGIRRWLRTSTTNA